MKLAGFFLMAILGIGTLKAQSTASVSGIVFDTLSKNGLAFSTISIVHLKDSTLVSFTRADAEGKFKLSALPKGNYLITFSYVGYVPVWLPVKLSVAEQLFPSVTITVYVVVVKGNALGLAILALDKLLTGFQ